jgi:dTDP-4-dehydrorhamnose 3,5-epimerase
MVFQDTGLAGAVVIELDKIHDERGFFARSWCASEFAEHGLNGRLVQCNVSRNRAKGTLRGMHYQAPPHEEAKLVRCTMGAIYDVIVDMRRSSSTYLKSFGAELSAENHRALYVPEGFAHGFLTLTDESEVFYQMSEFYAPQAARGLRWNDPLLAIAWPGTVAVISERDRTYPDFRPEPSEGRSR